MPINISSHPLIQHKLTFLRNANTSAHDFRSVLKEITFYLGFEATRDLKLTAEKVTTPANVVFEGNRIGESIAIIPVLRAGLGMTDALLELMPYSRVHHLGRVKFLSQCTYVFMLIYFNIVLFVYLYIYLLICGNCIYHVSYIM